MKAHRCTGFFLPSRSLHRNRSFILFDCRFAAPALLAALPSSVSVASGSGASYSPIEVTPTLGYLR